MNIAIILTVSEYKNENPLPGCVLDGKLIKRLLDITEKYKEILFIDSETDSFRVKEILSDFIRKNKGNKIEEIFFYYTGHEDFRGDEFYFILSDFDKDRYRQTSLPNSELDNFFRQLSPNLTVKVIDACHSGVTYVKNIDALSTHLNKSTQGFKNCYFMFSSMNNQSSYQDHFISDFTKSFIDSITKYPRTEIRYKHIIDYISDGFERNALQQPLFVTQAGFTEVFCSIEQKARTSFAEEIYNLLENQLDSLEDKSDSGELRTPTLTDLIQKDAENIVLKRKL